MQATDTSIDTLNSLFRGELSATETYQQAMEKLKTDASLAELKDIHVEHREAANTWRKHIHMFGGKPDQDSGAWGTFAKLVEGSAKAFGKKSALKALKEGEEHGIKQYESALKEDSLAEECKTLIRTQMIPQTRQHIALLDRLMAQK